MTRVLVFGRTGQVATELARRAPQDMVLSCLGRDQADLTDPDACTALIAASDADVVINAAAYTAVDRAEEEEALATAINATSPGAMAQACAALNRPFLHISTDYVFDGSGSEAWRPEDEVNPLSVYGRSKLAGEMAVRAAAGPHVILRTSWVFSAHGANFVKTMLRLGAVRDQLSVVADQTGGPAAAADIADALLAMARAFHAGRGVTGTYHFSGAPNVTWADFAREIFAQSGLGCDVEDIPTSAYPTPAQRPRNSRLDCSTIFRDYGILQPSWHDSLRDVLQTLKDQ